MQIHKLIEKVNMIKYSTLIILFALEIDKYLISEIIDKKRLISQIYEHQQDASDRALAASGVSDLNSYTPQLCYGWVYRHNF